VDLATGRHTVLAIDAYAAVLGGTAGDRLVVETGDGTIATVDVLTGRRGRTVQTSGVPMRAGSTASAGAEAPPGSVPLAAGGRPDGSNLHRLVPSIRATRRVPEVAR
jgi:hypothetical protein